jgi:hypothetical protein
MTRCCPNCAGIVTDQGLHPSVGVDWLCAHCGAAGTLTECDAGGRNVVVREVTLAGDPAMRRDWVPAESMPYAERVRPIGGQGT